YRGLHELASGTRVVRLPWLRKRRSVRIPREQAVSHPEGLPERLGPYHVRGALRWNGKSGVLAGEDPGLSRAVGLGLRPAGPAPRPAARRATTRAPRPRWVAAGRDDRWQWDVFLAPAGCALPDLLRGGQRLTWPDVRPILEQLTEELAAACREGTVPRPLSVEQVWVQPNGRVMLLETPVSASPDARIEPADTTDEEEALGLRERSAVWAREARPRPRRAALVPVRAPVPGHAAGLLDRLLGRGDRPYTEMAELQADLAATQERPTEVTPAQRGMHLAVLSAL